MEKIKQELIESFNEFERIKRRKLESTLVNKSITVFEKLPNELVYEIFEYLDFYHIYESFLHLNDRLNKLILNSNLPIRINISMISKSNFAKYNETIIMNNIHRINSIHLSNIFAFDLPLSPFQNLSVFTQLKALIVKGIEAMHIQKIISQLFTLPNLSSLTIETDDVHRDKNMIYKEIFRLPTLKYCKLSLGAYDFDTPLMIENNIQCPIENLVIVNNIKLEQLNNLLSFVPRLRRLTLCSLSEGWPRTNFKLSCSLKSLTHLFIQTSRMALDRIEQILTEFSPCVEVLHISVRDNSGRTPINPNRWEGLISSNFPSLRIFDIECWYSTGTSYLTTSTDNDEIKSTNVVDQFISPFWNERKWYFAQRCIEKRYEKREIIFSVNPYRRKYWTLWKSFVKPVSINSDGNTINSVEHLTIESDQAVFECSNYFSNVSTLTFDESFSNNRESIGTVLNNILLSTRVHTLIIKCHHFSFTKMTDLLSCLPNLRTLVFQTMPFYRSNYESILENKTFQILSKENIITDVTFKEISSMKKLSALLALCRRIQCLTINIYLKDIEAVTDLLINASCQNNIHLSRVCFLGATRHWLGKLNKLMTCDERINGYMLKLIERRLHLGW